MSQTNLLFAVPLGAQALFNLISPLLCSKESRTGQLAVFLLGFAGLALILAQHVFKIDWLWVAAVESVLSISSAGITGASGCQQWIVVEKSVAAAATVCLTVWLWFNRAKKTTYSSLSQLG